MILYVAICALLAFMGGIVYYSTLDIPELEKSEIELYNVEVIEVNNFENYIILKTTFLILNHGEKTVTVPVISYQFFANGEFMGTSNFSSEDIPLTGRALLISGMEIPFTTEIKINLTKENENEYMKIANGEHVDYSADGLYTIETAWQVIDVEFKNLLMNQPQGQATDPVV
jgi:hypothetical protein